jgi:uncharacterized LabA/DUF88 family protein
MRERPVANIYVDGFNLYRQKLQHHPDAKWLDLETLSTKLLPTHDIQRIRYFTALIRPALGTDPQAPIRQQTYLRALRTNPKITIHEGQFRHDARKLPALPISFDANGELIRVRVRKTEEKGSDVNLASYMVFDASRKEADVYVLVSNDSDFADMLGLLTDQMQTRFGLFTPVESPSAKLLERRPLFIKQIRRGVLLDSQFPDEIDSAHHGRLTRPTAWVKKTGAP